MDGQIFAPCNICTSTIHGGRMPQGAREGGAAMSREYGQIFAPCNICTSTIHGGRMPQGARDGGAVIAVYRF